jgi:hypothetical protein
MRTLSLSIILMVLGAGPAHAEASATKVLQTYQSASDDGKTYLRGYMIGLVTAYGYTNAALRAQRSAAFYCVPKGVDLGDEEVIGLMQESIRKDPQLGQAPFGVALFAALQRRFPCKKDPKPAP